MLGILAPGLCCGLLCGFGRAELRLRLFGGRFFRGWDCPWAGCWPWGPTLGRVVVGGGHNDELPQLAEFATEVPKRRMGVIRHLWPSIRGCLDAGHSVRAVLLFYEAMVGVMFVGVGSVAAFEITIASSNR